MFKTAGDFQWKQSVRDIMESYSTKTDGSFIQEREATIIWNYKDVDQEFGKWVARELTVHLEALFSCLQIQVLQGKKSLEVWPTQLKLKKFVKQIQKQMQPVDFVLFLGDDDSSEPVFQYLNNHSQLKKEEIFNEKQTENESVFYSVTIGRKVTKAKYYLKQPDSLLSMLQKLGHN